METGISSLEDVGDYKISQKCPMKLNENLRDETEWSIRIKSKQRDRLSKRTLRGGYRPVMVHYPVEVFSISRNNKKIDLMALLPENWNWDAIRPASPEILQPEVVAVFARHQEINLDDQLLEVGPMHQKNKENPDVGDLDENARVLLWNVLLARCVTEGGYPANKEGWKLVTDAVLKRREKVLAAFDSGNEDPSSIATMPFATSA